MPSPAYIICSDLRSEDKKTNRVSFFNTLEKVIVAVDLNLLKSAPSGQRIHIGFEAAMTAVWLIQDSDKGHEFDNRVYFLDENGDEHFEFKMPPMKVDAQMKGYFHRVNLNFHGLPPLPHPGVWRVVNAVRKVGDESEPWITQSFPFVLEGADEFFAEVKSAIASVQTDALTIGQGNQS